MKVEPITCVFYESLEAAEAAGTNGLPPVGAMWFDSRWATRARISPKYLTHHAAKRPPLVVVLPNPDPEAIGGIEWCMDTLPEAEGDGWDVTGDPPRITVSPSIHMLGIWHGYLTDGVLTTC